MSAEKVHDLDTKITSESLKKCLCLMQITRSGDLIQTTQAVRWFRYEHPGIRIILIARKQYYRPVEFLVRDFFDHVYELDTQEIINSEGLISTGTITDFIDLINKESIDVMINLSYSKSSIYLMNLLKSNNKIGPYFDINGNININDHWSQYLYSNVLTGAYNPFSLVDIYKKIIGVKNIVKHNQENIQRSKNIVIHPFASNAKKHWRPEKWTEIIYKILKTNPEYNVILVGGKEDYESSVKIISAPILNKLESKILNWVNTKTLEDVYITLKSAKLFIGHDSVVGHLAAFAGATSLTISLGPVRPQETTPYGQNAYCIYPNTKCFPCTPSTPCDFFQCHNDVSYLSVNILIDNLIKFGTLNKDQLKEAISPFQSSSVNIFASEFTDKDLFKLTSQMPNEVTRLEVFHMIYRTLWLYGLSQIEEKNNIPEINNAINNDLNFFKSGLQHLYELTHFAKKFCTYILQETSSETPSIKKIKEYSQKVDEIDSLLTLLKSHNPFLAPIINFHLINKSNIAGKNIVELTESTYLCFESLTGHAAALFDLADSICIEYSHKNRKLSLIKNDIEV